VTPSLHPLEGLDVSHRRPLGLALSGLLVATTLALALPSSAQAAMAAPTGLAPTGAASSSTPTFSWSRVSGATGYQLVVTEDATSQAVVNVSTANNKYVPVSNLADGSYSWQVRALGNSGQSSWANARTSISPTSPPSPVSPVGGTHLSQPRSPVLLTWSAVSGATGYEVQVDPTGTTWTNPTTYQVKGNSYFVDTPQAAGTWYWRVRAVRGPGLYTSWSSSADYVVDQLPDPQSAADMNTGNPMQDVRIDWLPVDGATAYQLQVGRDPDFNNIVDDRIVDGTSFSPGTTYDNDQYYWRVRAIDAGSNRMPWSTAQPFTFQRNWPDRPTLEYPANQLSPTVGDPMYYQWTAVRRASRYQLDVGSDPNFSPGTYSSCTTSGTTFPVNGQCGPMGAGATTYWRVKGLDDPRGVEGIFSEIHHFVYSSGKVTQLAPINGATVDVPTLSWQAKSNAQSYVVTVRDKNGNAVANVSTSSTTWTPEAALPATGNPYSWTVQTQASQGLLSPLYPAQTFNVSGTIPTNNPALVPLTGLAGDPATTDFPDLTWGAVSGASYYMVRIGVQGSNFWDSNASHISTASYAYPAATDTGTHYLSPGTYFWFVDAYDSSNHLLAETPGGQYGQFTIADLAPASGQEVALDGLDAVSPTAGCTNSLSDADPTSQICTGVPATPVLKWDPEPGAAGYLIYLANDRELTNRVVNPYAVTTNTLWRPPNDLPDNTAQDAYYWFVRPCKSLNPVMCNPDPISTNAAATNAFRKLSPAVSLQSPANGASVATDPSFSWSDYYATNQQIHYTGGTDPSYQTARTYRIQISQSSTFSSTVDDREVDQPYYTPNDRTLPQGTLYWRVQVVDPAGNHVTWSPVRSFSNDQTPIQLANSADTSPGLGSTVGGTPTFRWSPVNNASAYQIEVYRNNDVTHSDANRVIQATTRVAAYVPPNYLPTSSSDYRWRVRWFDADGQPRPWSSDATFSVTSTTVTLNTPATGTFQPSNGLYFSWNPAPFSASYSLVVRDAASNNTVAQWNTAAPAYAPDRFGDGSYEWRVLALDPNGNQIAASSWRTFTVDSQGPVVTAYSPTGLAKPTSLVKVTFNEHAYALSTTSVALMVKDRTSPLPAKITISSSGRNVTLTPKSRLAKGKVYTVKLSKAIHDKAGNHLTAFSWSFTT
jgi:hypothetical protein